MIVGRHHDTNELSAGGYFQRSPRGQRGRQSEAGDTLIEVLIALVVIGLTATALLGGFSTSITASADHKSLATIDTVLKSFIENATYQIELEPAVAHSSPPIPMFTPCATTSSYPLTSTSTQSGVTYSATISSVQDWIGNTWLPSSSCTLAMLPPPPQLITAQVSASDGASESLPFVVTDPSYAGHHKSELSFRGVRCAIYVQRDGNGLAIADAFDIDPAGRIEFPR
jgi:type II secretory pathway pseudopilin PulG